MKNWISFPAYLPWIVLNTMNRPFHRGFFCDDESLSHPYKPSTVPTSYVMGFGITIMIVLVSVLCVNAFVIHWSLREIFKSGLYFIQDIRHKIKIANFLCEIYIQIVFSIHIHGFEGVVRVPFSGVGSTRLRRTHYTDKLSTSLCLAGQRQTDHIYWHSSHVWTTSLNTHNRQFLTHWGTSFMISKFVLYSIWFCLFIMMYL